MDVSLIMFLSGCAVLVILGIVAWWDRPTRPPQEIPLSVLLQLPSRRRKHQVMKQMRDVAEQARRKNTSSEVQVRRDEEGS